MGYYHHYVEGDIKISPENLSRLEKDLGKSISALAEEQDYTLYIGQGGNGIDGISFDETKRFHCDFFKEIAPYVEQGSYIQIANDDKENFRYVYQNGIVYQISPKWEIDNNANQL